MEEHVQLMDERLRGEYHIFPVTIYRHSGTSIYIGNCHGFDHSNGSFYFAQKSGAENRNELEKLVNGVLAEYSKYINGEIYEFMLYDEQGEVVESGGNIFDVADIKELLGADWKGENMMEYLV